MKSAGKVGTVPETTESTPAATYTGQQSAACNTGLLTCVMGASPCGHILPSHRKILQWLAFAHAERSALAWPHAHSTVRVGNMPLPDRSCPNGACGAVVYYGICIFNFQAAPFLGERTERARPLR